MTINDEYKVELIDVDNFKILHVCSSPPRLEAKIIFDRDHISQKLIFTLMEISHTHGFGCSPPHFKGPNDPVMIFLVGVILPSKKSLNKYIKRMRGCLTEIQTFANNFSQQLDFSTLDISMFGGIELDGFYPEHLAALKDQNYNGSWKDFYEAMLEENRKDEAEIVQRCMKFEELNAKDIGLVGHKLSYILHMLDQVPLVEYYAN
jgi:hypothetical protein